MSNDPKQGFFIGFNPFDGEDILVNKILSTNPGVPYLSLDILLVIKAKIDASIDFAKNNNLKEVNDRYYHELNLSLTPESSNRYPAKARRKTRVYLMIDHNTGYYKIGRSNNPLKRESTLQSEKPTIELIGHWEMVYKEEKALHDYYSNKRIRGEWFALTPNDVEEILAMYETEQE